MRLLLLLGLLTLTSGPTLRVPDAIPFAPPRLYETLYQQDVACAKIANPKPFEDIVWYVVPGENFRVPGDTVNRVPLLGLWVSPDTIYLSSNWVGSWVPKHEMIHYLLQRTHWAGDTAVFGTSCRAMWGYLPVDTTPMTPGVTTEGPARWGDRRAHAPSDFLPR